MKLRTILLAAAAASSLAFTAPVIAQPMMGGGHHWEAMEILHSLKLTDAQKQQVHKIMHESWQQSHQLFEQLRSVHEQIASQIFSTGSVTQDQFTPLLQQQAQLEQQLAAQHIQLALQIRAVLTPEQLAQASTLHSKLEALHQQEHAIMGEALAPEEPPQ